MDEGLISIVIANILDNSVKYTRGGVIEIAIALRNDCLELRFSDQGPGIPVEQAERVLNVIIAWRRKNPNGTGLGLYGKADSASAWWGIKPVIDGSIVRTFAMEFKVTGEQPVISPLLQT
jgi:signal transduction histidine kinase